MSEVSKPTTRRYSSEFKERAVRMVRQLRAETGEKKGTIGRVAEQLGCGTESLRSWVRQSEVDRGEAAGVTTVESEKIKELRQEVKELRRANAILRSASAFMSNGRLCGMVGRGQLRAGRVGGRVVREST